MLPKKMILAAHLLAAIYNLVFVYTPVHNWEYGFPIVQYVSLPVLVITGMMMGRKRKAYKHSVA